MSSSTAMSLTGLSKPATVSSEPSKTVVSSMSSAPVISSSPMSSPSPAVAAAAPAASPVKLKDARASAGYDAGSNRELGVPGGPDTNRVQNEIHAMLKYGGQIHPSAKFEMPPFPFKVPLSFLMRLLLDGTEFAVRVVIPQRYPDSPPRVYIEHPDNMRTGPKMGSKSIFEDSERLRIVGKSTDDKPEIAVKFDGVSDSIYLVLQRTVRWCMKMQEEWKSG